MIIVRMWEGLANQMFQYAFARSLEIKTNNKVRLDFDKIGSNLFEQYAKNEVRNPSLDFFNTNYKRATKSDLKKYRFFENKNFAQRFMFNLACENMYYYKFYEEKDLNYHPEYYEFKGNYYIKGWFQKEEYFKDIRETILNEFSLKNKLELPHKIEEILQRENVISLHVRRGDYLRQGYAQPLEYYQKAISLLKEKVDSDLKILVFSDDICWCKHYLGTEGLIYPSDYGISKDYEDITLMSMCKHNIISNSTFSWWGAWLNQNPNKIVIAPKVWKIHTYNICPNEWIRL